MLAFSTPSSPSRALLMIKGQAGHDMPSIWRRTLFVTATPAVEITINAKAAISIIKICGNAFMTFTLIQRSPFK
jgi:hypothetical protein